MAAAPTTMHIYFRVIELWKHILVFASFLAFQKAEGRKLVAQKPFLPSMKATT